MLVGRGARIRYHIYDNDLAKRKHGGKKVRMGTLVSSCAFGSDRRSMLDVVLDGDPFGTYVAMDRIEFADAYDLEHPLIQQIQGYRSRATRRGRHDSNEGNQMPVKDKQDKPSAKELRREAKRLGIKGWEEMGRKELQKAVEANSDGSEDTTNDNKETTKMAKTAKADKKAKKADKVEKTEKKAKKAATTEEHTPAENGNPFREGTNLFLITEELLEGGKRSAMVKRLKKVITLKPRSNKKDFDVDAEMDRRVLITAQILENEHGFTKEKEGRGEDATIVVTPPRAEKKSKKSKK